MNTAYLLFDTSGSNEEAKKYYMEAYNHYKEKYDDIITLGFSTVAEYKSITTIIEEESYGGTYVSSGICKILNEILCTDKQITIIICTDGSNWSEDNFKLVTLMNKLNRLNIKFIYHEILPDYVHGVLSNTFDKYLDFDLKKYIVTNKDQNVFGQVKEYHLLFLVEHKVDGKRYLFRSKNVFDIHEIVICNTKYGKTYGKVVGTKIEAMSKNEYLEYKTIECINKEE